MLLPSLPQVEGFLLTAPCGSEEPENRVVDGVFTDSWDAAWVPLGVGIPEAHLDGLALRGRLRDRRVPLGSSIAFALSYVWDADCGDQCMIGWESLGHNVRLVCRQTSRRSAEPADPPAQVTFEIGDPVGPLAAWSLWTAG